MEIAIAHAILNAIVTIIIAGVVMTILKNLDAYHQTWITRRDLLQAEITKGVAQLYTNVKRARRQGRVSVINGYIDQSKYAELLNTINETQLELERFKRAALIGASARWVDRETTANLTKMDHYLDSLITEYEHIAPTAEAGSVGIAIETLSEFAEFLSESKTSKFHSEFVDPYHCVVELAALGLAHQFK